MNVKAGSWLRLGAVALAVASVAMAASVASAQAGGGWSAWLGCWQPVAFAEQPSDSPAMCVIPGSMAAQVELVAIEGGFIVDRQTIDASGARIEVDRDGCAGWESAVWSADGRRLFRESMLRCEGDLERESSGIFSITSVGDWVAAEAVSVGGDANVRIIRYEPAPAIERQNRSIVEAIEGRSLAIDAARTAASTRIGLPEVIEASRRAHVAAVEGWLIENAHGFDMDADKLIELAGADVPESVIDLMVALSYPRVFAINQATREGTARPTDPRTAPPPRRGYPWYYPSYRGGGYYPGYYGGYYGRPVIIVRDPGGDRDNGGRAVSGRGYTRRGGSGGSSSGPSSSGGPSTSTGPSGGSDSSRPSGGSDTGRTAKPRS